MPIDLQAARRNWYAATDAVQEATRKEIDAFRDLDRAHREALGRSANEKDELRIREEAEAEAETEVLP